MDARERQKHWQSVYTTKRETDVSWFEENPAPSLDLIALVGAGRDRAVIDIGGGASRLVNCLLLHGYEDLTVLDVSAAALETAKARIGDKARRVHWLVADATTWEPSRSMTFGTTARRSTFSPIPPTKPPMSQGFGRGCGPAATSLSALSRLTAPRSAAACRSRGTTPKA